MIEINGREIRLDDNESLLAWADADHIVRLAMDFIRRCPIDERTGLPWYVGYSCFWTDPLRPTDWPDNPAGKCGMAAETLVRYAKDKRCDLIYIGTRGMTAVGKALVGSTATKVLHLSDTPVLLVK